MFTCNTCGAEFTVAQASLDKYPGWVPKQCLRCKGPAKGGSGGQTRRGTTGARKPSFSRPASSTLELNLTVAEVLARFHAGPTSGLFTDGSAQPNPGPGGWGCVYVVDDKVVAQRCGHEPHTTNNRMELMALIEGVQLVPQGVATTVFTDSELCVKTFNEWAHAWKARGWKRKGGEIKNLELVQRLYGLLAERPWVKLQWIKAHDGSRYNEYADSLATAYTRTTL